jgi:hypothetical protein
MGVEHGFDGNRRHQVTLSKRLMMKKALSGSPGIGEWIDFYNNRRPHSAHGGATPAGVYRDRLSASGPGLRPALQPTVLAA